MSFEPKVQSQPKFTSEPYTWKTARSLIGASPSRFCQVMAPKECKEGRPDMAKECAKLFEACVREVTLYEEWHRRS
jgi:hypothetical protein